MIDYKDSNKEQMKELHYLTSKQEIASVSWNYEEAYASMLKKESPHLFAIFAADKQVPLDEKQVPA